MQSSPNKSVSEFKKLPSATTSVVFFLTMTLVYGFMMIYNIIGSGSTNLSLDNIETNSNNQIYTLIYILILISGTYFINVNVSKSICNENTIQWSKVFFITILPWIIIFGILYFLLELFPGWIKPFSNTIGYLIVNTLGITRILKKILINSKDNSIQDNTKLQTALKNIEKNYSIFINEIDIDKKNFIEYLELLFKEEFIIKSTISNPAELLENDEVKQLFALVNIKHIIGKLFWYVLAGSLIASVSYNFIVNMDCEKTLKQAEKEYSELYEKLEKPD